MENNKYRLMLRLFCILPALLLIMQSCKEEQHGPLANDRTVPQKLTNIRVERLPGAVKFTYDVPNDQIISYVKAECLINNKLHEVKASSYVNTLTMEGFPDTAQYTVTLYTVSRSEIASQPEQSHVKPRLPLFRDVFKTMNLLPDFGGVNVSFENPKEAELAITIARIDSFGYWQELETFYTKRLSGSFAHRGMDTIPTTFGVYVRDKWNNYSDTLSKELTPMFEKQVGKSLFRAYSLPGDDPSDYGWVMSNLWNNSISEPGFHTTETGRLPKSITIDLGAKFVLSRFKYWQRQQESYLFTDRNPKRIEIWGSEDRPDPSGSWDGWTLLTTVTDTKPSGLPRGQLSNEDRQHATEGAEFSFPLGIPSARYVRLRCLETWGGNISTFYMMEIDFWGQEVKQ